MQSEEQQTAWIAVMKKSAELYHVLLELGTSPEIARSVLPLSLKTEITMTANLREWRHFFSLRLSDRAHPQIRQLANMLLKECKEVLPIFFEDFEVVEKEVV